MEENIEIGTKEEEESQDEPVLTLPSAPESVVNPDATNMPPIALSTFNVGKSLLNLSWPLILRNGMTTARSFTAIYQLGHLTDDGIAGYGLANMAIAIGSLVESSFFVPLLTIIAQNEGANNSYASGSAMRQAWLLGSIMGIPTMALYASINPILTALGQPPAAAEAAAAFLRPYLFSVIASRWVEADMQLLIASGHERALCIWTLLTQGLGIGLNIGLIQEYGIEGAGYAAALENILGMLFLKAFFCLNKDFRRHQLFTFRCDKSFIYLKLLLKNGSLLAIISAAQLPIILFKNVMIGWLGSEQLTLDGIITLTTSILATMFTGSFSQAALVRVGETIGAKDFLNHRSYAKFSRIISIGWSMLLPLIYLFAANQLLRFFVSKDSEPSPPGSMNVLDLSPQLITTIFVVQGASNIFDTWNSNLISTLQAISDFNVPAFVGLLTQALIALPLAYLFSNIVGIGLYGIYLGALIGSLVNSCVLQYRWEKLSQDKIYLEKVYLREKSGTQQEQISWQSVGTRLYPIFGFCCRPSRVEHETLDTDQEPRVVQPITARASQSSSSSSLIRRINFWGSSTHREELASNVSTPLIKDQTSAAKEENMRWDEARTELV